MTSGQPPLIWNRSKRARRISLRVDPVKRAIIVTYPDSLPIQRAEAFILVQESWIQAQIALLPDPGSFQDGTVISFDGRPLRLHHVPTLTRSIQHEDGVLFVGGTEQSLPARASSFLRQNAKILLPHHLHQQAQIMRVTPVGVICRDTKTRWGSCTRNGKIMLNWRLILMPVQIRDYILVHELSHLVHFDHSRAFWDHVEKFHPQRHESQSWLKKNGSSLLALR